MKSTSIPVYQNMMVSTILLSLILAAAYGSHGNVDDIIEDIEDDDSSFDILEEEGQPGWFEKILELGKKEEPINDEYSFAGCANINEKREFNPDLDKRGKIPSLAQTKLSNTFNKIGPDAEGAKTGLAKLNKKWNEISSDDRGAIVKAVQTSATLFEKFSKADEDPVGAVRATIDIISQFTALAGPKGQIISIALSFVSGFLALFGAKSKTQQPDFSKIVRKEIDAALDKYYEKVLTDEIAGSLNTFVISKAYVDSLSKSGETLTKHQALSLKVHVPLWNGLTILGKLEHRIKALLKENKRETVEKLLKYIELYARLASLKDMILLQSIALLPDKRNRAALLSAQLALRRKQKSLLEFLYNAQVNSKLAVRYFDPDLYPIADKYLIALLKVPDIDRSLAGTWCMTMKTGGWYPKTYRLGFGTMYRQLMMHGHPYVTSHWSMQCIWKLVPHGNNLYTISRRFGCPRNRLCSFMSHDEVNSNKMRVTIEPDADFWEITGDKKKQIRSKWGCDTGNKWCNTQMYFAQERIKRRWSYVPDPPIWVAYLTKYHGSGFVWEFSKP